MGYKRNKRHLKHKKNVDRFYNIDEQRFWNDTSAWEDGGHEWSVPFGTTEKLWNEHLFSDLKPFRGKRILEIAPGYGRITQFLSVLAGKLVVVDLNELCIEKTREKLGEHVSEYIVNSGNDLPGVKDESQDLVFSYDSFVHMHRNVVEDYIGEISRVLITGGIGYIHHANIGGGSDYSRDNVGGRANMNPELFREMVESRGMEIIEQRSLLFNAMYNWDGTDTISVFRKSTGFPGMVN